MKIKLHINNESHYNDFIRLNEKWISHHFSIEVGDIKLAQNPSSVVDKGGYILSLVYDEEVIGVCALFNQGDGQYELARLAVDERYRRNGHGDRLITEAFNILEANYAKKVNLMSNTKLKAALSLYKKHGFTVLSQGEHPIYTRCNIMMEKDI